MQAKLIELLSKYLIIPLLQKLGPWIIGKIRNFFERIKRTKKNKKLGEQYANAQTPEERKTTFEKLP